MRQSRLSHIENYIHYSTDTICFTDLTGQLIFYSGNWQNKFPSNGKPNLTHYFPEVKQEIILCFNTIAAGAFQQSISCKKVYQNETHVHVNLKISPGFSEDGITGFFVIAEDVKESLERWDKNNDILTKKFNDTFYYSVIGMAIVSPEGKWIEVNDKVCEMLGYSKSELLSLTFQDVTHPDDLIRDMTLFFQLVSGEIQFYQVEKRYYSKAGHIIWVNLSVSMMDEGDKPSFFISQIEDITATKKAKEKSALMEDVYKEIFNASYQFTALLTPEGKIREINNAALGFLGIKHKESVNQDFWELPAWKISPELQEKVRKNIEKAATGEFMNYEEILLDNLQNEVIVDFTLKPVLNENQQITSVIAEGKVVQEIIDARTKLLESEKKLRTFFNLSPVGFVVNDLETGNFIELNGSILENTGYTKEDFLSFNYWNLFPNEYRWMEPIVIKNLKETGVFGPVQIEYVRKDGVRFPIQINGLLTKSEDGRDQIWSVVQDITELKAKEFEMHQLNQAIEQRNHELSISNNELEQFAYIASHDLQEPLRMISGFLSLLETNYKHQLDEKARQYIHFSVNGATRMRQIIVDILDYSKIEKEKTEIQTVNLEEIIEMTRQLFSGAIHEKNAQITSQNLPLIKGQKAQIQQLFNNLISNSLKYQLPATHPRIEITYESSDNQWQFCIADNGIGIDPLYRENVFTLFTRLHSKKEFEGSGIGLAICRKIVEKHGGKIWAESTDNKGSKFYFTLSK